MSIETKDRQTITHDFPVWRERADFILAARLPEADVPKGFKWEQIWAKQVSDGTFEICCIPFVSYGLALGDWVSTKPLEERIYVIHQIVQRSGRRTYRVWFNSALQRSSTIYQVQKLGCLVEERWKNSDLIAIDSPNLSSSLELENILKELEESLDIEWETGS
ncbi:MAG: DUF4265 domain-containing protein [Pyrinomonadaceae bacterium]|nr:DUF4265 domain-containing protein [Pyrinomonadaceae bacterium]